MKSKDKIVFKKLDNKRWIVEMPMDKDLKNQGTDVTEVIHNLSEFLGVPEKNLFVVWGIEVEVKQ